MSKKNLGLVAAQLKATLLAAKAATTGVATTLVGVALDQLASLEAMLVEEPAAVEAPALVVPPVAETQTPAPAPVAAPKPAADPKKAAQVEACYREDRQQAAATQPKQQGPKQPKLCSGVAGARKPQAAKPAATATPARAKTEAELVEAAKAALAKLTSAKVEAKAAVAKAGQLAVEKAEALTKAAQADLVKAEAEAGKANAYLAEAQAKPGLTDVQVGGFANLASAKAKALAAAQTAAQNRASLARYWSSPEGQATAKAQEVVDRDLQPVRDRLAKAEKAVAAYRANQARLAGVKKSRQSDSLSDLAVILGQV